jgi:hypothetical protein
LALLGIAFGLAILSCGRDVTSPGATARVARGIAWQAQFPPAYQLAGSGASGVVDFNRVHVVLHHSDGSIALDTVIDFPAGADSVPVTLTVKLLADAPASGEPLTLNLGYINAAGDTVFKGGPVGVTATPSSPGSAPPPAVTIPVAYTGPGSGAVAVQISPRSGTAVSGTSFSFTAVAVDQNGVAIPGTPVVWNTLDPSIAAVPSAASGTVIAGSTRGTARIVAQLLTGPTDQVPLTVVPLATAIVASSGSGQSGLAGTTLANPLVAFVTAADGLGVGGVTVTFAVASGGGSVGSATAITNSTGLAQTTWKLGSATGTQTVTASAGSLSGSPVTFSATARSAAATKLEVTGQPATVAAGATIATVTVLAETATGDTASSFTGPVTLALGGGSAGATLGGTATVNAVAGVATFSGLQVTKSGTGYALAASSTGLTGATTNNFDITAGAAAKLAFTTQPTSNTVGISIGSPTVTAQDQYGNTATTFTGLVTLALVSNPGASTISGTPSANAVAGIATFGTLTLNHAGSGYTLSASAAGLTTATSGSFDIFVGGAASIAVVAGAGQSGNINAALVQPVIVQVQDLGGNGVPGKTVTFAVVTGGGSLSVTSGVSDASGNVTTVWTLGATVGAQSISATSAGLSGSPLTINATGTVVLPHFIVTTQPGASQTAGVSITPSFVVAARDPTGAPIPTFTGNVTIAIGTNPSGGTLSGTLTVAAVAGVATFSAFSIDKAGAGYTLVASAAGYTSVTSSGFAITAAAASTIAISSGNAQTGAAASQLATPLSVLVTDAFANPVSGRAITWATTYGGGSVDSVTSHTNAAGIATTHLTLGPSLLSDTVTATSAGLAGSPLKFGASATGSVASTTVTAPVSKLDTLTSIGATYTATAQAKDGGGNNVAGTFAWLSRTPAVATVNAAGLVTAVMNGSTWVVVTESGGTKDSALFVVQQKLATINVTPASRSIYLGASSPAYTASAVDGLGVPLTVQPSFSWSTVSSAIATITVGGVATGTGIGSTQVQATSGAVTGVSVLNVVTRIKNIYVARDSAGLSQTADDAFTITALGRTRSYKAFAYDSTNSLLGGITFTFATSNGAVASFDSTGTVTVRALAAANGVTTISASAQGVSGAATLTVQQVLTSIVLTPSADTIAVSGSVALVAHGKDAGGSFIPGGTFHFFSSSTANATVGLTSGVVTGVANGSATITAKDSSNSIVSNNAIITIGGTVPARITFGNDTLTIGRSSSNVSIPVYLSKPNGTAVTVNLAVKDTFAFFSPTSITIGAGATSANATLNGHNAGTTKVYGTDGSGTGYAGDTVTLAVQATVKLTTSSYSLNVTDQQSTQVLLSDPAPAGGTYVTFGFGTAGIATVSPNPAYIPAGQLAANIVIAAIGAGNTTITPAATGVNGTASTLYTYTAVLGQYPSSTLLGAGQYYPNAQVSVTAYLQNALGITLASSDSTKVSVSPGSLTIPANTNYGFFQINGLALGAATITSQATAYTGGSTPVTVTTPRLGMSAYGGTTLNTTSPSQSIYVYAEDSTGASHYRISTLAITLSSSDTTVLKVLTPSSTIAANSYYTASPLVIPGGAGGTAWLKVTASGHTADSVLFTVVGPKLSFDWTNLIIGAGQQDNNYYSQSVSTPNSVTSPLTVNISNSNPTAVTLPTSVIVTTGTSIAPFTVTGNSVGTATFIASATGYQPDTASYTVTTPRLVMYGGYQLNNFGPAQAFTTYATDSAGSSHNVTNALIITFTSTNPSVLTVTGADTVQSGNYYTSHAAVTPVGTGSAKIIATATGYTPDTLTWTVVTPQLRYNSRYSTVGKRQYYASGSYYVYTPSTRQSPLAVTITHLHHAVDTLSSGDALTIATNSNIAYFGWSGLTLGTDTLVATAPGYLPDTAIYTVSTPRLYVYYYSFGSSTTTSPPVTLTVYVADSNYTTHYPLDTVLVKATSSNIGVIQPTASGFKIAAGSSYQQSVVDITGPGQAYMTYSDSLGTGYAPTQTDSITVTGPSLAIYNYAYGGVLGMRQNGGANSGYVQIPNSIGSPLTVNLLSTDTTVVTVPATVTIPAGQTSAYFQVTAHDVAGTIQIQATATGYGGANVSSQVTAPKFLVSSTSTINTTSAPQPIYVYAQDANGTSHYTNENVVVTLASSSTASAIIDSATVTILQGTQSNSNARLIAGATGSTQLSATDARVQSYRYNTGTFNVAVNTPSLSISSTSFSLGVGQYVDYNVFTPDAQPAGRTVNLSHLNASSSTPSTVNIPVNGTSAVYRTTGASAGIDTITFSATAHNSVKGAVIVTAGQAYIPSWPSALSVTSGDSVYVTLYAADAGNNTHNVASAVTFTVTGTNHVRVNGGNPVIIPANASYVNVYVTGLTTGSDANIQFSATGYTTQSFSTTVNP